MRPLLAVEGDAQSPVDEDAIKELVALAKADKREDFDFLAGAVGVPRRQRQELWRGTRARLNKPEPQRKTRSTFPRPPIDEVELARRALAILLGHEWGRRA